MALPCCPPFAQGGLFLCPGGHNRQRQRKERVQRHAGRRAAAPILSLPGSTQPAKAKKGTGPASRWPSGQAVLPHQIAQQSQTQKSSPEQQESFFLCVNPNTEALYTLLPSAGAQFGCGGTPLTRFPVWRRRAGRWDRFPHPDPPARLFWPAPPDPDL